ncbi:elongation factor 1-delta-like isoform X2 [Amblyomma americanum]
MAHPLTLDSVWLDKAKYDDAEKQYLCYLNRDQLAKGDAVVKSGSSSHDDAFQKKILQEHNEMKNTLQEVLSAVRKLEARLSELEKRCVAADKAPVKAAAPPPPQAKVANHAPAKKEANDDDDDIDLFGSEEDEEANKARDERLKAYQEKKSKKPQVVAKSNIVLDVKPWDDETDMKAMEENVRRIEMDGLLWGASKLVPLAYGINKLQIVCVVEDDKVSIDELQEKIEGIEDLVQSVDIAAFNKI